MAGLILVVALAGVVVGFLIVGNLVRIADAIEAQNKAYGIGVDAPDTPVEEETA